MFLFSFSIHAMNGRTTYQAKISKPDGYPLEAASVNFRFTVLDTVGSCILYIEDYAAINMHDTGGLVSFALGNGTRAFPTSGTSQTFQNIFDNSVTSFPCQNAGVYNPGANDTRRIVMQFNEGVGWQTLPAMTINAVPYSMYANVANNSKTLNGKTDTSFVEYAALTGLNCQSHEAIKFNGVSFSCIPVSGITVSGSVLAIGGTASAPVISMSAASMSSDGYLTSLDYAEFKAKIGASSTQIINTLGFAPVSASAVTAQIAATNLSGDVSGALAANSVVSVGGKTAAQISTSVDETLAATASNTANTIVKRNSQSGVGVNYFEIYKPATSFNVKLQAPTSLAANYTLNLPSSSGTVGQVLSTDGSGNLSWVTAATGSVTSVSATAPLISTGGATPSISITQATSTTQGYLSSTDWNTFNNKQAATFAAIIATLGYTPADNAVSGTYVQKANNLSDLANIVTARTNLGLGSLAVANSIDLGSASATGIISEARFVNRSGVTSGTQYTKVTVDGKGFVTNGSNLSSGDVTSALGYTPASATASTQWTTSGTTINYTNGNVGLGTTLPTAPLHIKRPVGSGQALTLEGNSATTGSPKVTFLDTNGGSTEGHIGFDVTNGFSFMGGKVGIGTTGPAYPLDVSGVVRATSFVFPAPPGDPAPVITARSVPAGQGAATEKTELILFHSNDYNNGSGVDQITLRAPALSFQTYSNATVADINDNNGYNERMYIAPGGDVGIGTTTPSAKLDVQGQVKTSMGTPLVNPAGNAVDFASGNTQYVTFSSCPGNALTVNLFSIYEGSSYSIIVIAPSGCVVDFTGISHANGGSGGVAVTSFKYPAGQKFSSTGNPMVYSFLRANNFCFVAQVVDFQ